jgi:hypothetical protein
LKYFSNELPPVFGMCINNKLILLFLKYGIYIIRYCNI